MCVVSAPLWNLGISIVLIGTVSWTLARLPVIFSRPQQIVNDSCLLRQGAIVERSLTWMRAGILSRFTCTRCEWSHPNPSGKDVPETLDAGVFRLVRRAFLQHLCAPHPFAIFYVFTRAA